VEVVITIFKGLNNGILLVNHMVYQLDGRCWSWFRHPEVPDVKLYLESMLLVW